MSHTKEPWSFSEREDIRGNGDTLPLVGISIPMTYGARQLEAKANARRIVACINACAGKKTEDLEAMAGKDIFTGNLFSKRVAMEKERDQLLELCGELIQSLRHIEGAANDISCTRASIAMGARNAITKAEKALGGSDGNS